MRVRRLIAAVIGCAVTAPALVSIPVASAQTGIEQGKVLVTHSCTTRGTGGSAATISPNEIDVTYPEAVKPGEVFPATIWPGPMRSGSETGRFTYAIALPPNVDVLDVSNAGGEYGLRTSDGRQLEVELVNATGNPDRDGAFVRISAGMTPNFGGDTRSSLVAPFQWGVGLYSRANTDFRLPKVEVVLRAPVNRDSNPINVGLHGGTSGQSDGTNNALQYLHTGTWSLGQRYYYCGRTYPSGVSSLTRTAITTDAPIVASTQSSLSGEDRTLGGGEQTTLQAFVEVNGASAREMSTGDVVFRRADTNEILGRAKPDRDTGEASLTRSFASSPDGDSFDVTAAYAGVARGGVQSIAASTAAGSLGVTLIPNRIHYGVSIDRVTRQPEPGGQIPVQISTTITRPGGGALANGLQAQLYRDGQAVGSPQPASGTMTFDDVLPRTGQNTTYYYEVKLLRVDEDNFAHGGQTAGATGVIISGSEATAREDVEFVDAPWSSSDIFVPGGKDGSLELGAGSIGSLSPFVYGMS